MKSRQTRIRGRLKAALEVYVPGAARFYRKLRDDFQYFRCNSIVNFEGRVLIAGERKSSLDYRRDSHEIELFFKLLSNAAFFVDVGANIGFFSCLSAKKAVKTIAIEPSRHNAKLLYRNIHTNKIENIEVFPIAAGNNTGLTRLWGSGQGASVLQGWGGIKANYYTDVPINSLDNLLADRICGHQSLIKIDVEGAEFDVLCGARQLLRQEPAPSLLIEIGFNENFGGSLNPKYLETFKILFDEGYECLAIEAMTKVTPDIIESWVANKKRGFYSLNFAFTKGSRTKAPIGNSAEMN